MNDFVGSKVALLSGNKVVVILRDNKPGLKFANNWDFAGGRKEGKESPLECALRETEEELSIKIDPNSIVWEKQWPGMSDPNATSFFYVANISDKEIAEIKLGDEGQRWELMDISEFLNRPDAIAALKDRLRDYLERMKPSLIT